VRRLPFLIGVAALLAHVAAADEATPVIELTAEQAASFPLAAAEAADEPMRVAVLGQVLDPLPFVDASRATVVARAALAIAERERARVTALARADLDAARARAVALWGRDAEARAGAAFVARLARREAGLARLEVPAGVGLPGAPSTASVRAPALGDASRDARVLGPAPDVDPALRGRAFLIAFDADPPPVGAALEGALGFVSAALRGAWVPEAAIVWEDGASAVFVAVDDHRFRRQPVDLAPAARAGFFVASGLAPGERFVASGAQQLLSAEIVAGEPEREE